jgi:hypothetical protein
MKNYLLYIAMFLLILCLPLSGSGNEVRWLWEDLFWIPLTLIAISLMCTGFYLYKEERNNKVNVS